MFPRALERNLLLVMIPQVGLWVLKSSQITNGEGRYWMRDVIAVDVVL